MNTAPDALFRSTLPPRIAVAVLVALSLQFAPMPAPAAAKAAIVSTARIEWSAVPDTATATARLMRSDGTLTERRLVPTLAGGWALELGTAKLADGQYHYEVTFVPVATSRRLVEPVADDGNRAEQRANADLRIASGTFTIKDGALLMPVEEPTARTDAAKRTAVARPKDIVNADDVIVQGSLCAGLDCVNNESFGFDTVRLKENNTRIGFNDTSVSAGFPNNNWQLTANDAAAGGANKFSIDDVTGSKTPFTVMAGARTNALFVDSTGRVGLGTGTPVLDLHIATSNTPAVRFEQDNSGGFTAQTWDVGANEANWFVRDVTGGSRLPLRIRPGAPTSSIDIAASGAVGVGTASPTASLHVSRTDGTAQVLVEENSTSAANRTLLKLSNNGTTTASLVSASDTWDLTAGSDFRIAYNTATKATLTSSGSLTIAGTLTTGSSRTLKEGIALIDSRALLEKVAALPLYTWRYRTEPAAATHLGPMAEDFHRMFRLGSDERSLAPADVAGVALGAAQALMQDIRATEDGIRAVEARLQALERRLGVTP